MNFLRRPWTDAEKWAMGIVAAALLAGGGALWSSIGGEVVAEIASHRYQDGRCIDSEILISNGSRSDAAEIGVAFDVDRFTAQGSLLLEYGDERPQVIPPGQETRIPRRPYLAIPSKFDPIRDVLTVGVFKPGQYAHLFYGGETVLESDRYAARHQLIIAREPSLMDKPRIVSVSRKDGQVKVRRIPGCRGT